MNERNMSTPPPNIESRVTRIESEIESLTGMVRTLVNKVDQIASGGKTSWPLVVSVLGVASSVIITGVVWGGQQAVAQARAEERLNAHVQMLEFMREDVVDLREDMQVQAVTTSRIEALRQP